MPRANAPDTARLWAVVGERVRKVREKQGLSREELANAVGVSKTSITQFESGYQHLPLSTIYLVAAVLDTEISQLLPPLHEFSTNTTVFQRVQDDPSLASGERRALLTFFEEQMAKNR